MDVLQLWDRSSDNLARRENIVHRVIRTFESDSSPSGQASATAPAPAATADMAKTGKAHLVYESITRESYRKVIEEYGIIFAERIVQHLSVLKEAKLYPLVYYRGLAVIVCSRYGPVIGDELIKMNVVLLLKWTLSLNIRCYQRHILYTLQMLTAFCKLKLAYKDIILNNGFLQLILDICYISRSRVLHEKVCALVVELLSSDSYADTSLFLSQRMRNEAGAGEDGAFIQFSSRSILKLLHNRHITVKRSAVLLLLLLHEPNNTVGKKCLANIDAMESQLAGCDISSAPSSWKDSLLPHLTRLLLFGDRTARFESAELCALLYLGGLEHSSGGVCRNVFSSLSNLLFLGTWYPEVGAIDGAPHVYLNLEDAFETLTRERLEPAVFVLYVCNRVLKHVLSAAGGAAARSYSQSNAHLQATTAALGELSAEPALCEAGSSGTPHGSISLESTNLVQHPAGSPFRLSSSPSPRLLFQSQVVTVSLQASRHLVGAALSHMRAARLHLALLLYILKSASLDAELGRLRLDLQQQRMGGQRFMRALFDNVSALRWHRDEDGDEPDHDRFDMGDDEDDDLSYNDTYLSFMPPRALVHMRSLESEEDVLGRMLKVYRVNMLLHSVATLQRWLEADGECESDLRAVLNRGGLAVLEVPGGQMDLWGTLLHAFCGLAAEGAERGANGEGLQNRDMHAEIRKVTYQLQKDLEIKSRLAELDSSLIKLASADSSAADESSEEEEEGGPAGKSGEAPSKGAGSGHENYKIIMNALLQKTGNAGGDKDKAQGNLFLDEDELEEVLVKMKHDLLHKEAYKFGGGKRSSVRGSMRGSLSRGSVKTGAGGQRTSASAGASPPVGRVSASPVQLRRTGLADGYPVPSPPRRGGKEGSPEREITESKGDRLVRQIAKDALCNRGVHFANIYTDTLRDLRTASVLVPVSFAVEEGSDDEPSRADSRAALDAANNNAAVTFDDSVRTGDQNSISTLTVTVAGGAGPRSPRSPRTHAQRRALGQKALLGQQKALLDPSSPMQRAMRDLAGRRALVSDDECA